jgi:hypothetical protein
MNDHVDSEVSAEVAEVANKEAWVKPEIVDHKPVTIARGISVNAGDGISNLS